MIEPVRDGGGDTPGDTKQSSLTGVELSNEFELIVGNVSQSNRAIVTTDCQASGTG